MWLEILVAVVVVGLLAWVAIRASRRGRTSTGSGGGSRDADRNGRENGGGRDDNRRDR